MNILFLDCETTGLDYKRNTIIEIAARLDSNGTVIDRFNMKLFNPQTVTNLGALKVNKTKLSSLLTNKPEAEAIMLFVDWLLEIRERVQGDIILCGQNPGFDIRFLMEALHKYGIEGIDSIIGYKTLDTYGLALALAECGKLKTENNKLSLVDIAKALNVNMLVNVPHTATGDVEIVAEVLYKLLALMKG